MENKAKGIIVAATVMMFVAIFVLAIMKVVGITSATIAAIEPYMLVALAFIVLLFFLSIS